MQAATPGIGLLENAAQNRSFLEVKSGGEWAWSHSELGLPIPEALADILSGQVIVDRTPHYFGARVCRLPTAFPKTNCLRRVVKSAAGLRSASSCSAK